MRKALLIGLIVCVLAIGGIGAAFANQLGFGDSVGALASGTATLPEVNVDGVKWPIDSEYGNTVAYSVKISFDQDLGSDVGVGVDVLGDTDDVIYHGYYEVTGPVLAANYSTFSFPNPIPVEDIYGLHVVVSVETGP